MQSSTILEYDEVMDVPGNRSEKKWTDADHDKQEKIAKEIEKENPGISRATKEDGFCRRTSQPRKAQKK